MTYTYRHTKLMKHSLSFPTERLRRRDGRAMIAAQRLAHVHLLRAVANTEHVSTVGELDGGRWQLSEGGELITVTVQRFVTWEVPA
jgi:hypothetical protein